MLNSTRPGPSKPRGRNGGRPHGTTNSERGLPPASTAVRTYKLPPDLAAFVDSQGGAAYVRRVLEANRINKLIV